MENESEMEAPRVSLPPASHRGLPAAVSEAGFLAVTEKLAGMYYNRFGKLHGDRDDFQQQVCLWCLEAVERFDPTAGSLGAFLHRQVRNRSLNVLRDRVTRADPPCPECHAGAACGPDGRHCERYAQWAERNQRKANIFRPLSMSVHPGLVEGRTSPAPSAEDTSTASELSRLVDEQLPVELRADYLKMRDSDVSVPLHRRQKVQRAVADILRGAGLEAPECESGRSKSAAHRQYEADGEQESGEVERQAPLGAYPASSNPIPGSVAVQSGLSLLA